MEIHQHLQTKSLTFGGKKIIPQEVSRFEEIGDESPTLSTKNCKIKAVKISELVYVTILFL